jgi:hypothetical protein
MRILLKSGNSFHLILTKNDKTILVVFVAEIK